MINIGSFFFTSNNLLMTKGLALVAGVSFKLDTGVSTGSLSPSLETLTEGLGVSVVKEEATEEAFAVGVAVLVTTGTLLDGIFFKMSSLAFHPSCEENMTMRRLDYAERQQRARTQ